MDKPLTDQVALITGAGQGVGQGIAFGLAKRGVRIIAVGRTLAKCEATVNTINIKRLESNRLFGVLPDR